MALLRALPVLLARHGQKPVVCRGAGVFGLPTGLPLSARHALILASALSVLSWPGRLGWVAGCLPGPKPAAPTAFTARPALGPTPCASRGPSEAPRVQIWKLRPPLLSLSPPSLLPSSCALSLSLLLPNTSWLRLNISPPRFLAPALGAFTKRRRASSPLPCPPVTASPFLKSPSEGGSGLVQGPGSPKRAWPKGAQACWVRGLVDRAWQLEGAVAGVIVLPGWPGRRVGRVWGHGAGVSGFWWGWQASVRRSCAQNSELCLPPLPMWLRQPGGGGGWRALRLSVANRKLGLHWGAFPPLGPTLRGAGGVDSHRQGAAPSLLWRTLPP